MSLGVVLLFAALAGTPPAEESCPWLNVATAGGLLGGPIRMHNVSHRSGNREDAICTFVSEQGSSVYELRMEVETMPGPRRDYSSLGQPCSGAREPLKSLGNEAGACAIDSKGGRAAEQVSGRIRDRAFVISVSTNDGPAARNGLRVKARKAAEHVAGSLF